MSISTDQARDMVDRAIRDIVPDADIASVADDADLRASFELDSLDFLEFVERLSKYSGVRVDEVDYPELASMSSCTAFLNRRSR
jgi:acyl carrier protein